MIIITVELPPRGLLTENSQATNSLSAKTTTQPLHAVYTFFLCPPPAEPYLAIAISVTGDTLEYNLKTCIPECLANP